MKIDLKSRHIDNGFYYVTEREAIILCEESDPKHKLTKLPRHGYERRVNYDGNIYWLGRTTVEGKEVWTIKSS